MTPKAREARYVTMEQLWAEYGALAYVIAFGWSFLEGETFVIFASAIGRTTGLVNPWILMGSVWIGSFLGDQLWFLLGRRYGPYALRKIPGAEKRIAVATGFLAKYGDVFVLSFRFIYGIRNVASAACGIAGMSFPRFATLNFIAAGLWANAFVWVGWFVGGFFTPSQIAHGIGGIGLAVFVFFIARYFIQRRNRNRMARVREAAEAAQPPQALPERERA
ncbi:MAG: DedA family protein [Pseudomonadota bacterium]